MSKQFREGYVYVFTSKKFMQWIRKKKAEDRKAIKKLTPWYKYINGMAVKVADENNGITKCFSIEPEWCKCIGKKVTK